MSFRGSALLQVVTSGDENVVAACIADGADVNARNDGGQTPLILAIVSAQTQLLRPLLQAGANPFLRDNTGLSAIDWAERKGRSDLAKLLSDSTNSDSTNGTNAHRPSIDELPSSKPLTADEKSRKFLAGLKQRLDEKADRQTVGITTSKVDENGSPPSVAPKSTEPLIPLLEPVKASTRKRCPECNRIYTSDLLAYCAYHVVPLVDADQPIVTPKQNSSSIFLWATLLVTLGIAAVAGLYLTNLLFGGSNKSRPATVVAQTPATRNGIPVLGRGLIGKAVELPQAQPPAVAVTQPTSITVQVRIDKSGKVLSATSNSGERPLREVAIEAAKRATFSVEKLQARGAEGTITYTFSP